MSDLIEVIPHDKSLDKSRDDPDKHKQGPLIKISPNREYLVICIDKKFVGCNFDKIIKEGIQVDVSEENENTKVGSEENKSQNRKTGGNSGEKGITPVYRRKRTRHVCVSDHKILAYIYDNDISKYNYVNLI